MSTYCVSIGSCPFSWSKILMKTGTMKSSITISTSVAKTKTTDG